MKKRQIPLLNFESSQSVKSAGRVLHDSNRRSSWVPLAVLLLFFGTIQFNEISFASEPSAVERPAKPTYRMETFKDLIEKAQNLTLQRDRLQASQVLIRGIQKETKNSPAYKELTKALDSLAGLFYSEKAHGLFSSAESMAETKPKEAADVYSEALRLEDSNLSLLKGLGRVQLSLADCSKADATTTQAEGIDPFSAEVKLLRLQVLSCQKSFLVLKPLLVSETAELEPVQKFVRGLDVEVAFHEGSESTPIDLKKTKTLLANWETKDADYPELYYWKWKYFQTLAADEEAELTTHSPPTPEVSARTSALKYMQICQSLSPRKRRNYGLDVKLCRSSEEVDAFLKSSGQTPTPAPVASPAAPKAATPSDPSSPSNSGLTAKSVKGKAK